MVADLCVSEVLINFNAKERERERRSYIGL